jgi:methyl-accepting chemotaxis protein
LKRFPLKDLFNTKSVGISFGQENNMKIKSKLTFTHLLMAVLPMLTLGVILTWQATNNFAKLDVVAHENGVNVLVKDAKLLLENAAKEKLLNTTLLKKNHLEDYFKIMESRLHVAKDNPYVVTSMLALDKEFMEADDSINSDGWRRKAKELDPFFKDMCKDNHWIDVFLMCPEGSIVYTQEKESDLGLFVTKEPLMSSGIGDAYAKLKAAPKLEVATSDFSPYAPNNGAQAAFMMARLFDDNGEHAGHIAFQISSDDINAIVQQREGLGKTGETYLVGKNKEGKTALRSDRVVKSGKIGDSKGGSLLTKAFDGKSGVEEKIGSAGKSEVASYCPLDIAGLNWIIFTSQSSDELLAGVIKMEELSKDIGEKIESTGHDATTNAKFLTFGLIVIFSVIGIIIAHIVARGVFLPIEKTVEFAQDLSKGDLRSRLPMGKSTNCYESRNCKNSSCASYGKKSNCWVECGTFSANPTCDKAKETSDCRDCEVYKKAVTDELQVLGSALNAMADAQEDKAAIAEHISQGDLTVNSSIAGEHDRLGKALGAMLQGLREIVSNIRISTEQVNSGSTQISDASQSLSQGATETAASMEEISASMTEIGGQTKQNAENAQQANTLATGARTAAETGNEQMQGMVTAMSDIQTSSTEITKIIKTIDDIAFQTNLLALNAAVEAARAGRHGKGFAVVAEEVRNLASRSAKAAKETADLIESSNAKVTNGTQIASQTSGALTEIVKGITKSADLIAEIAVASNEQAQGISQVSQGLTQIDGVTQQNTANAEETASTSEELSSQAQVLQSLIAKFKLNQDEIHVQKPSSKQVPLEVHKQIKQQQGGWGNSPQLEAPKEIKPSEVIALDDNEFGKY